MAFSSFTFDFIHVKIMTLFTCHVKGCVRYNFQPKRFKIYANELL
jgi:hypothetical protein